MRALLCATVLVALLVSGANADLTKPYFNLTIEKDTWNKDKVGKAFSSYFGQAVIAQRVNGGRDDTTAGSFSSYIFEFLNENGASTDVINQECKSLANELANDYTKTIKSIKGQFQKVQASIKVNTMSAITRTTTFEFKFTADSANKIGSYAAQHNAMDKALLALLKKLDSGYAGTVETLMESSGTEGSDNVKTFQFFGSSADGNGDAIKQYLPLSGDNLNTWSTIFANNGGLALTSAVTIKSNAPPSTAAPETGFVAWIKSHPEIVAAIVAGIIIIIFAVVVVMVHRRAKRQEALQDTMEAMLGDEERKNPRAPGASTGPKGAPGKRPPGKSQSHQPGTVQPMGGGPQRSAGAPAPSGGQPAASPAPSGGQPANTQQAPPPQQQQEAAPAPVQEQPAPAQQQEEQPPQQEAAPQGEAQPMDNAAYAQEAQ